MNIKDKRGQLTAYGLSCGYAEQKTFGQYRIELFYQLGTYHLRAFETREDHVMRRVLWESFPTFKAARRHYNNAAALIVARNCKILEI